MDFKGRGGYVGTFRGLLCLTVEATLNPKPLLWLHIVGVGR